MFLLMIFNITAFCSAYLVDDLSLRLALWHSRCSVFQNPSCSLHVLAQAVSLRSCLCLYMSQFSFCSKIPQTGFLIAEMYCLTLLEARSPRLKHEHGWVLVRNHFLVCRWPPPGRILTFPFLRVYMQREEYKRLRIPDINTYHIETTIFWAHL